MFQFFDSKQISILDLNLIWGYITSYPATGVMMHFQSGLQDHLGCTRASDESSSYKKVFTTCYFNPFPRM